MRLRSLLLTLLAALVVTSSASGGRNLVVGVDDDQARWISKPMSLLPVYRELGVQAVRVTMQWQPGESALSPTDKTMLDRSGIAAWGMRLVLVVDGPAGHPPADAAGRAQYCSYVGSVLRRYPTVNDFVIWTEPNSTSFWRPQLGAPQAYEALLAQCWDALHRLRPSVNVIAASAPHQNPAAWYAALGAAYRASGRAQPILDTIGHNAYPETSREPPSARHTGASIDEGDYDRLIAVLQQAFGGTGQPVPGVAGVTIWYMEDGFQTRVTHGRSLYTGSETDRSATSEAKQAQQLTDAVRLAYCQPYVGAFFNFELRDETSLAGWQSGLLRADWSAKPSFYSYRNAIIDVVRHRILCGS